MHEVTRILKRIEAGDGRAADELLPLVYQDLRELAAQRMAREAPGRTLQATALVHEAYLRLVGPNTRDVRNTPGAANTPAEKAQNSGWDGRAHFFAAAAEAMRRILVEQARQRGARKNGGECHRMELDDELAVPAARGVDLLALDEALSQLELHDASAAQLVKLRYFGGMSHQEAAEALGITRRAADRLWALARAWLFQQLSESE